MPHRPPVGSSADIGVGQKVLAIGNPFGLHGTLTTGIILALDQELPGADCRSLRGLIQTDAAIFSLSGGAATGSGSPSRWTW